jgi:hypothetical protein
MHGEQDIGPILLPPRKSFFAWLNPDAAADAELDATVAELLSRDVEKRRRNAWLRKIDSSAG